MSIVSALNAMPVIPPEVISGVVLALAFIEVVRLVKAARQILSWVSGFKKKMIRKIRRFSGRKIRELLIESDYVEAEKSKPTSQGFVAKDSDDEESDDNS